jgi:hypothetical protein
MWGTYEVHLPQTPIPIPIEIALSDGKLWIFGGEVVPTFETTSAGRSRVDLVVNDRGEASQLIVHDAGVDRMGTRR